MMLDPGTRFGPYVVTAPVATGGMGAVFLARDTRLDRPVALKVLRDDRRSASERARVEREARILAQLTHPRICTLLDIVQTDDDTVLVMEALDGDTLADRVARNGRRGLAVDECLAIAADVSEGLAYAHRHGVVHGDVKPSNIMLTAAGAKLLDFGIAHLRTGGALSAATDTATTDALLRAGTLQYMAPEQLDGRADARSDLFALGAVLFEMLTGIRAFEGATTSDVIARILGGDRPKLPETVDPSIGRVVRRCLAIDPDRRWQSAGDLADELRWIAQQPSRPVAAGERSRGDIPGASMSRSRVRVAAWGLGLVAVAGLVAILLARASPSADGRGPFFLRADLAQPVGVDLVDESSPALSRDGRFLAYIAAQDGTARIFLRDLQTADVRPLPGTDGGADPFWSPDGRWLAFFAEGALKRVAREGGSVQTIAAVSHNHVGPTGADWNRDDVILFNDDYYSGAIWRVSASGGEPTLLASPNRERNEQSLTWPRFLPNGRQFVYLRDSGRQEDDALMVRSLDRDDAVAVAGVASSAIVLPSGELLFVRNRWLTVQQFDADSRALRGEPRPLVGPVTQFDSLGGAFDATADRLVYRPEAMASLDVAWHSRDGRRLDQTAHRERGLLTIYTNRDGQLVSGHALSDGRKGEQSDLWLWHESRGTRTRLTTTDEWETSPVLSPEGSRLAFGSDGRGTMDLFVSATDRPEDRQLLASQTGVAFWPNDWSSDGRLIVGTGLRDATKQDIWLYDFGTRAVSWLLETQAREAKPRLSSDGRWMAYQSDESGQYEVYVAPLAAPSERWRVSNGGGAQAKWRQDGRELYYVTRDDQLRAVTLEERNGRLVAAGSQTLFVLKGWRAFDTLWSRLEVSADGSRFLVARPAPLAGADAFGMFLGWRQTSRPD